MAIRSLDEIYDRLVEIREDAQNDGNVDPRSFTDSFDNSFLSSLSELTDLLHGFESTYSEVALQYVAHDYNDFKQLSPSEQSDVLGFLASGVDGSPVEQAIASIQDSIHEGEGLSAQDSIDTMLKYMDDTIGKVQDFKDSDLAPNHNDFFREHIFNDVEGKAEERLNNAPDAVKAALSYDSPGAPMEKTADGDFKAAVQYILQDNGIATDRLGITLSGDMIAGKTSEDIVGSENAKVEHPDEAIRDAVRNFADAINSLSTDGQPIIDSDMVNVISASLVANEFGVLYDPKIDDGDLNKILGQFEDIFQQDVCRTNWVDSDTIEDAVSGRTSDTEQEASKQNPPHGSGDQNAKDHHSPSDWDTNTKSDTFNKWAEIRNNLADKYSAVPRMMYNDPVYVYSSMSAIFEAYSKGIDIRGPGTNSVPTMFECIGAFMQLTNINILEFAVEYLIASILEAIFPPSDSVDNDHDAMSPKDLVSELIHHINGVDPHDGTDNDPHDPPSGDDPPPLPPPPDDGGGGPTPPNDGGGGPTPPNDGGGGSGGSIGPGNGGNYYAGENNNGPELDSENNNGPLLDSADSNTESEGSSSADGNTESESSGSADGNTESEGSGSADGNTESESSGSADGDAEDEGPDLEAQDEEPDLADDDAEDEGPDLEAQDEEPDLADDDAEDEEPDLEAQDEEPDLADDDAEDEEPDLEAQDEEPDLADDDAEDEEPDLEAQDEEPDLADDDAQDEGPDLETQDEEPDLADDDAQDEGPDLEAQDEEPDLADDDAQDEGPDLEAQDEEPDLADDDAQDTELDLADDEATKAEEENQLELENATAENFEAQEDTAEQDETQEDQIEQPAIPDDAVQPNLVETSTPDDANRPQTEQQQDPSVEQAVLPEEQDPSAGQATAAEGQNLDAVGQTDEDDEDESSDMPEVESEPVVKEDDKAVAAMTAATESQIDVPVEHEEDRVAESRAKETSAIGESPVNADSMEAKAQNAVDTDSTMMQSSSLSDVEQSAAQIAVAEDSTATSRESQATSEEHEPVVSEQHELTPKEISDAISSAVESYVSDPMCDFTDLLNMSFDIDGAQMTVMDMIASVDMASEMVGSVIADTIVDNQDQLMANGTDTQAIADLISDFSDSFPDMFDNVFADALDLAGDSADAFSGMNDLMEIVARDMSDSTANPIQDLDSTGNSMMEILSDTALDLLSEILPDIESNIIGVEDLDINKQIDTQELDEAPDAAVDEEALRRNGQEQVERQPTTVEDEQQNEIEVPQSTTAEEGSSANTDAAVSAFPTSYDTSAQYQDTSFDSPGNNDVTADNNSNNVASDDGWDDFDLAALVG